jgi:hypothetical protein
MSVFSFRNTRLANLGLSKKPIISPSSEYSILMQSPKGTLETSFLTLLELSFVTFGTS